MPQTQIEAVSSLLLRRLGHALATTVGADVQAPDNCRPLGLRTQEDLPNADMLIETLAAPADLVDAACQRWLALERIVEARPDLAGHLLAHDRSFTGTGLRLAGETPMRVEIDGAAPSLPETVIERALDPE